MLKDGRPQRQRQRLWCRPGVGLGWTELARCTGLKGGCGSPCVTRDATGACQTPLRVQYDTLQLPAPPVAQKRRVSARRQRGAGGRLRLACAICEPRVTGAQPMARRLRIGTQPRAVMALLEGERLNYSRLALPPRGAARRHYRHRADGCMSAPDCSQSVFTAQRRTRGPIAPRRSRHTCARAQSPRCLSYSERCGPNALLRQSHTPVHNLTKSQPTAAQPCCRQHHRARSPSLPHSSLDLAPPQRFPAWPSSQYSSACTCTVESLES